MEEFNKNVYDIIIASDEHEVLDVGARQPKSAEKGKDAEVDAEVDGEADGAALNGDEEEELVTEARKPVPEPKKKKRKSGKRDKEYGISRGIDFKNVACVINFDLPTSSKSYTHRIGRTARAGKTGMSLSFVVPKKFYRKHKPTTIATAEHDEEVLEDIIKHQAKKGKEVKDYHFDMKQVDSFRYRMNDALRAVTGVAIREARTRELRQELIKSDKLQRYFEENPDDLRHLRHDGELRAARTQDHLKHVPEYLLPTGGKSAIAPQEIGFVGFGGTKENKARRARAQHRGRGKGRRVGGRNTNPLKTFSTRGRKR